MKPTRHTAHRVPNLRSLSPRARVRALRVLIRRQFGGSAVGFRFHAKPRQRLHHSFLPALLLSAFASAIAPAVAHAGTAGTLDLNLNLSSIHLESWARHSLNQTNPGAGLTYHFDRTWALMGGEYKNSYRRPTWYGLIAFTPLHIGDVDHWHLAAGVVAGLASGYTRVENQYAPGVAGALVRIVAPSGFALNVLAVPNQGPDDSGFVGFQLAFPLH